MRYLSRLSAPLALAVACSLTATHVALPVWAQDAKELSEARAKFQRATELEKAGNCSSALPLFREVGQVKMTPQVRYHIAYCEEELGQLVAAMGGYELALEQADQVGPGFKKEVQDRADQLQARIPKLLIERGERAEAARISVDGTQVGRGTIGKPMSIDPGGHMVIGKVPGKKDFSETVTLEEGEEKKVVVTFPEESEEPRPGSGPSAPGDQGVEEEPSLALPLVIGGVGVAALIGSGVLFMLRQNAISDLDDACGPNRDACPADSQSTYDDAKFYNLTSQIALGVGVVGVGVGAALLLTQGGGSSEPEAEQAGIRLSPSAPGSEAGVSLVGRF